MKTKTLALDLGLVRVLQEGSPTYTSGWYVDPFTGQRLFYDQESQNFYTLAGGVFIPLGYMNPAPKQVTIGPGEKLKISISYKYSGPAVSGAIERFCVGVYGAFGFNEQLVGENTKSLASSTTPLSYTGQYTFTIPTSVGGDWDDIYCKIYSGSPRVPPPLFGGAKPPLVAGE